ncbi:MAG: ATP-grasp domain-containing protein [Bacteroidota bacterium]
MYVIIQSNIYSNSDYERIFPILDELKIPFEKIDLNSSIEKLEISQDRSDVFVYGSVKMAMLGKKNSTWNPGSFYGGNHLFEINSKFYKENLLNFDTEVKTLSEKLDWNEQEEKFIKPYKFAKLFTGNTFTKNKWENFVEEALRNPNTPLLNSESLIQISKPREIIKEARLWIVGGKVIEAIYYKILKDIPFEENVEKAGIDFAEQMISIFNVAEAFVMDICLTDIGWKIVEINCINSAGFFPNTDIKKVFSALNNYFTE